MQVLEMKFRYLLGSKAAEFTAHEKDRRMDEKMASESKFYAKLKIDNKLKCHNKYSRNRDKNLLHVNVSPNPPREHCVHNYAWQSVLRMLFLAFC